jgi:ABC-type molybdenum transport system ATPase subunit/photorepair protein PhrA
MRVSLSQPYSPLASFEWSLSPLTILVGPNGSGKTRLLDALAKTIASPANFNQGFAVTHPSIATDEVVFRKAAWSVPKVQPVTPQHFTERVEKLLQIPRAKSRGASGSPDADILRKVGERAGLDLQSANTDELRRAITYEDVMPRANEVTPRQLAEIFALWEARRRDALIAGTPAPAEAPPWEVFQRILDSSNLPYEVSNPSKQPSIQAYQLNLRRRDGRVIDLEALSSGEQVIFGIGTWLFGADESVGKPKLLLLDEPDAHLHPEMTKRFLSALETVLVKEHGVYVLMTTHSPTTVALARSEDSLFSLAQTADGFRPEKTSRDKALGELLVGVPSLRMLRTNTRQVFVESEYDEEALNSLQGCLQTRLDPEVSLHFIASGRRKTDEAAGCTRVRQLVQRLVGAGNATVRGLVDWDGDAKSENSVVVLCEGKRHSIENAVLDPLAMVALLIRQRLIEPSKLSLPDSIQWRAFMEKDVATWQESVEALVSLVEANVSRNGSSGEQVLVKYVGGRELRVPTWYLVLRGHDLERALIATFPKLNEVTKGQEHALLRKVCEFVFADAPELICEDVLTSLRTLQS